MGTHANVWMIFLKKDYYFYFLEKILGTISSAEGKMCSKYTTRVVPWNAFLCLLQLLGKVDPNCHLMVNACFSYPFFCQKYFFTSCPHVHIGKILNMSKRMDEKRRTQVYKSEAHFSLWPAAKSYCKIPIYNIWPGLIRIHIQFTHIVCLNSWMGIIYLYFLTFTQRL